MVALLSDPTRPDTDTDCSGIGATREWFSPKKYAPKSMTILNLKSGNDYTVHAGMYHVKAFNPLLKTTRNTVPGRRCQLPAANKYKGSTNKPKKNTTSSTPSRSFIGSLFENIRSVSPITPRLSAHYLPPIEETKEDEDALQNEQDSDQDDKNSQSQVSASSNVGEDDNDSATSQDEYISATDKQKNTFTSTEDPTPDPLLLDAELQRVTATQVYEMLKALGEDVTTEDIRRANQVIDDIKERIMVINKEAEDNANEEEIQFIIAAIVEVIQKFMFEFAVRLYLNDHARELLNDLTFRAQQKDESQQDKSNDEEDQSKENSQKEPSETSSLQDNTSSKTFTNLTYTLFKLARNVNLEIFELSSDLKVRRRQIKNWMKQLQIICNGISEYAALFDDYPSSFTKLDITSDKALYNLIYAKCGRRAQDAIASVVDSGVQALEILQTQCAQVSATDADRVIQRLMTCNRYPSEKASAMIARYKLRLADVIQLGEEYAKRYEDEVKC